VSQFLEVAKTDELRTGTMKAAVVGSREILVARIGDTYYAADKRCPHMKGDLSQGKLEKTIVTCPVHGSQFDISSGRVVRWLGGGLMSKMSTVLKLSRNLTVYEVKVEGDSILVEVEPRSYVTGATKRGYVIDIAREVDRTRAMNTSGWVREFGARLGQKDWRSRRRHAGQE
jgi:nitrite reductase/ring-hydroxylating ferredoxin subunit